MEKINEFLKKLPSLDEVQILNDETMEQTEGGLCNTDCVLAKSACHTGCILLMLSSTTPTTTEPTTPPSPPTTPTTPTMPTTPPLLPTTPTTT